MTYTHRLATPADSQAIAPLWQAFAIERKHSAVSYQLSAPVTFQGGQNN